MLARSSDISYASGEVSVWYKLCQKCARYVNRDSCGIRRSRKGILSGMGEFMEWYEERESGGRGVNSRMVTTITRLFGINLCQDMTERDKTGHYHIWA